MGFSFLPSEVARLVLGYLEEQKCMTAYNEFLNTSKHLEECKGRSFLTQIMGMSLTDILDDYCAVHSYVTNASLDDRIVQHLKKCLKLLDKIKLLFDGDTLSHKTPDTPPKNIYRRTRKRCNSTNSISTIQSEKSHNLSINSTIYAKELEHSINKPKCSTENLTESTNLADLPGHKNEYKPKQVDEKYLHNSTNFNSKLMCKRKFSKSLDNLCSNKTIKDIDELDFQHALGLIKQSDLLQKNSKTFVRRKGYKPRICLSARKSNTDNFLPNESLSITTISNTLLDFPELHRKIADNINKIKNERISLNKTDLTESKNSPLSIVRQEFNEVPKNSNILIDDFSENLENVVKSIVDITAKDPIFDQIINELTASFESISGSDSDVISRPDTSTPEHYSSNAVSRTSSFGSQENLKKSKDISPRTQKPKNSKLTVSNVTESVSETALIPSTSQKSLSNNSKLPQISYPRYSRGGKRMDVLKANYGKYISPTSQNSVEKYPNNEKLLITQNPEISQPKVIILSNERVQTNIVSTTGPIIISNIENMNENDKVVSFSKSKITEEKILQSSNLIKNLKCVDFKYKQQDKQYYVDEKNETSQNNIFFDAELISSDRTVLKSTEIIFQPPNSTNSLQPSNSTNRVLKETSATSVNSVNQPKPLRKVTGKPTDLVISNNGCIPIENQNINESSFVNITPTTEFEVVDIPQIISIDDEINNHYYENLPNGLIRLLPKIETHPDYPTFVKIEEPDKPNCEFQIIDAKGFGAYTSDTNSIAETKGSVPLILPTSYNSTVPTQTKEHLVLNKNHSNLQEINLFNIDNSAFSENKILRASDVQLEECVVIEINDTIEKNDANLKTPNGIHTVKKMCSSTPRKNSHIRILDFSTPEKANVGKRKAATSPKSISNKFRNVRSQSKSKILSKVRLFNPISENNTKLEKDESEVIALDSISPSNKLNGENDSINIDKPSNKDSKIEKKSPSIRKNNCKKNKKKSGSVLNVVKSKRSWDQDLRAMLGESFIKCNDEKVVNNTNKAKTKVSKVSKSHKLDSSLENDAKRLEDALNKSQDTPARDSSTFPKKTANVNDKVVMNSEQVTSNKSDSSVLNIIDDLDLSTNTTLDDSQSAAPKNVLSDNQNTSNENLNSKPLKDSNSFYSSFSKKIHMDDFNNVPDFSLESKKENHSSSTIKTKIGFRTNHQKLKVKIGSKMISAKKSDSGISTRIDLTSPISKDRGSTNDDSQSVEEILKSSLDQDIPDTSLTTPELPREYRSNPIDVKCNLSSILETPFKTCILDLSMRTPRFLSPGINSDPISMVKILGIPTPKFIDTPITAKTPELLHTPGSFSSKKTDYSSGSSYYKPDEVDAKFLSSLAKGKKKPNILSKSPRKKPPVSSTISKLLNLRRKMCSRPKRKTPVKKVFPIKKKISTAKPKKDNSKQITKKTVEYSLRSSSKLLKNISENEMKNDVIKSPNVPKSTRINTKYNSVSKKQQKDTTCESKKKGKSDCHLNKESKETETSAKVSSKDKIKNESAKNHPKIPTIKFSTVPDDIFSINKNLLLPHINSPSKSKRKSSTPRKIHSLSTQIDNDFIDNPSEFHMLKSSNSIIDCPNDGNFISSKLVPKNDTQKERIKDNVHNPKNTSSAVFNSQISKKLEQKVISTKITNTLIQELSDYSGQDLEDSYSIIAPKCLSEISTDDICNTPEKKSVSDISKNSSSMSPEQIKENVFDISANMSKSNEMTTTIKDCHALSVDENEPYLDITWSKHEVICDNYIFDSQKKKKIYKQKEPQNIINLEKLIMNVEVFDTQADCMKVTSLQASNFVDLFDMQPNVKPKNKTPSQKESKSSDKNNLKQIEKEDRPCSGLQMLVEEIAIDSSASESSSPIKNIIPLRKIGDLYASVQETQLAIKSILVEDNSIFSPIKITYENLHTEKHGPEEIEIKHDTPINKKTNVTIEKRKRESDSEDATLKKSKSSDSSANNSYVFKNFDIEEVLSKLHGSD